MKAEVGGELGATAGFAGQLAITGSHVVLEPAVKNAHAPAWSSCALTFSRVC